MTRNTLLVVLIAALVACKKDNKPEAGPAPGSDVASGSAVTGSGSAAAAGSDGSAAAPDPKRLGVSVEGLSTPESVLYDAAADVYLISNINGGPGAADDNGFISQVDADGKVVALTWIDGAAADVKLDAPKGMAIVDGTLWVADITAVRLFDAKTGKPSGEVAIAGATFLNDIVGDGKGGVYVTDTGVDAKFEPTKADAVYHIGKDKKPTPLVKSEDLGHPNGIALGPDGGLWVVTFGSGELYAINAKGDKQPGEKLPKGQLDGLVALDGGELLVTSWEGSTVYRGKPGGPWTPVFEGVPAPADIGWDSKRKRVLIPLFQSNLAVFPELK